MKTTAPIPPPLALLKKKKSLRSSVISAEGPRRTVKAPKVRVVSIPAPDVRQKEALDHVMGDTPRPL